MRAYRIAYDGRPFHGFQRQPTVPTVEDALFDALRDLDVLDADAAKPAGYAAAGRTDAGVSARAQTVAFDAPDWLGPRALNSELPPAVRAWASVDVPDGFHATHAARSRAYVYYLFAPPENETGPGAAGRDGDFDDGRARATLDRLAGEADFHNLTPDDEGTVRDLRTEADRDGDFLVIRVTGGGFARQLVRRVVGLVDEVARGDSPVERVERVLSADPLDGPEGVPPAAPSPLVLWDVDYEVTFAVDDRAAASARELFGRRHAERAAGARVARALRDGLE